MTEKVYWNEEIETMRPADMRTVQNERLQTQLDYIWQHSPFYREKFAQAGITRSSVHDLADLPSLPCTEKDECRRSEQQYPPFGDYLATNQEHILRVHKTSGTTGQALYIGITPNDRALMNECAARSFWASGLRPKDTVVHCFNYNLWVGGYSDHEGLEKTGATIVPFGVGHTKQLIQTIKELHINAIGATPSYMQPLLEAVTAAGLQPRDLGLQLGLFGAEPGMSEPGIRARIEETWGVRAMDANFGMADIMSILASECEFRDGLHFHAQDSIAAELINPETGAVIPLIEGAEGELIYTHLQKEAQPLVRYRAHDVVRIVGTGQCACGRTSFRFRFLGRSDDMLHVRGINVYPTAIGNTLTSLSDHVSGEFLIRVDHAPPYQYLHIQIELAEGVAAEQMETLSQHIIQALHDELNFRAEPELVPYGTLPRTEQKARRVLKTYE